jgi:hypothetical protein
LRRVLLANAQPFERIEAMLIPKFSLRTLLIATAGVAVLSLVLAQAVRGEATAAIAFVIALASVVIAFSFYVWTFAAAWMYHALAKVVMPGSKAPVVTSPFADARLPKQIVAPVDPE